MPDTPARPSTRSTPMLFTRQRRLLELLGALGGSAYPFSEPRRDTSNGP